MRKIYIRLIFKLFWVALAALALFAQTRLLLDLAFFPAAKSAFCLFGGTVAAYNFRHLFRYARWTAYAFGISASVCFCFLGWFEKSLLLFPVLIVASYYGFQIPGKAGLREKTGLKPVAIAVVWAWLTVILPAWEIFGEKTVPILALFLERAAFVGALALAYDLCDEALDRERGLWTFPVVRGSVFTGRLVSFLLGVSAFFVLLNWFSGTYSFSISIRLLSSLLFSGFVLRRLVSLPSDFYWKKTLVDGLMLGQGMAVF